LSIFVDNHPRKNSLDVGLLQDIKDMINLLDSKNKKDFHITLIVVIMLSFGII